MLLTGNLSGVIINLIYNIFMSKKVKNISGKSLAIPNIGVVKADHTVTVPDDFHNPNFEVAKSEKPAEAKNKAGNAPKKEGDKKNK